MRRVAEYKQHAKDCRALAESSVRPDDKVVFEEIAKAWDKIAALRERDLEESVVALSSKRREARGRHKRTQKTWSKSSVVTNLRSKRIAKSLISTIKSTMPI